jgi:hypothetical protein
MQYLVSVIDDQARFASPEEMTKINAWNDHLQEQGSWVFAGGLGSPDNATVLDNRDDRGLVIDGPFVESKEFIIGFWILEAPDLDAVLELAAGCSKACNRKVEVRPFLDIPA